MNRKVTDGVRLFMLCAAALAGFFALTSVAQADRAFQLRYDANVVGSMAGIANSNLSCPTNASGCTAARNATPPTSADSSLNNDNWEMTWVDTDGISGTTNSSSSTLSIPSGSTIEYAALYWGGRGASSLPSGRGSVKFRVPGDPNTAAGYRTISANVTDTINSGDNQYIYQSFANVTNLLKPLPNSANGTYWVADIAGSTGKKMVAGWSLVVVYKNPTETFKNITIFDGLVNIASNSGSHNINVSGFLTPPAGPVNARAGFLTWEGDMGIVGDSAKLNGQTISNARHPANNFFNSSIDHNGVSDANRNPAYSNNLGVDSTWFNAPSGSIGNSATAATISASTVGDAFVPGMVAFQVDIYAPVIDQSKDATQPGGGHIDALEQGDIIRYKVAGKNTGLDGTTNFVLRDPIPANTTYVPGSLQILKNVGQSGSAVGAQTDQPGDDLAEFDAANNRVVFRLGTGANSSVGGNIAPGKDYEVAFQVRVNGPSPNPVPNGTVIHNEAEATMTSQTGGTTIRTEAGVDTKVLAPDLRILKTRTGADFVAGGSSQYTLKVDNHGDAPTQGTVTVTDPLAPGLTATSVNAPGWSCNTLPAPQLTCSRTNALAAGANYPDIVVTVAIGNDVTAEVENTATVSGGGDANLGDNTSSSTNPVSRIADMAVVKTVSKPEVKIGEEFTYSLKVTNNGPSRATSVAVSDPLPTGLAFVSADPGCTHQPVSGTVVCDLGTMESGQTRTINLKVKATGSAGGPVSNTATVAAQQTDPDLSNNESTVPVNVLGADLQVIKTLESPAPPAKTGDTVKYKVEVKNNGPSDATGVVLHDALPGGLKDVTTDNSSCTVAGGSITCALGELDDGDSITIEVTGTVKPGQDELVNTASVTGNEYDQNPSNNTDTVTTEVVPQADLAIAKTASVTEIIGGGQFTYSFKLTNHGPDAATGVIVTDVLPAGLTFVSSPDCSASGQTVTCAVGNLAVDGSRTLSVLVKAANGVTGEIANTATVEGNEPDPDEENNSSTVTVPVEGRADLGIQKKASVEEIVPGTEFDYTFVVTNNGPVEATGVKVTDALPAGITFVSSDDCSAAGQDLTCAVGSLAVDGSVTLTVKVKADPAVRGDVVNTASVKGDQPDPEPDNDDSTDETPTAPQADLGVAKAKVSPETVKTGDTVTWQIVVTNNGPSKATGVVLTDELPSGLTGVSADSDECELAGGVLTCEVGDLAPGGSATIKVTGKVSPGQESLVNTASVEGEEPDPDPEDNTSTTNDPVTPQVDLGIEKGVAGVDPGQALVPGTEFDYTLKVTNGGPDDGTGVTVTDSLPEGLELVYAGGCDASGQDLTCEIGDLASGDSTTLTVTVKAGNNVSGEVTNIANVTGDQVDPDLSNNEDSATITGKLVADLGVTKKTVSPDEVKTGDTVTYEVTVKNHGLSDATGVVLTDQLPGGLTNVQVSSDDLNAGQDCTIAAGTLTCQIGDLDAGDSVVIAVTGKVKPGQTSITNTVSVKGDQEDPNEENNHDEVTDPVIPQVDLGIVKKASVEEIVPGTGFDYTFTVRNNGPDAATGVTVTDTLPAGITFVSSEDCSAAGQDLTCAVGSLAADASVTLTVKVKADPALRGDVVNTASVKGDQPDPDPENDESTDETPTDPKADLGVVKTKLSPTEIKTGDTVTYRIVVTNHGPSKATGVILSDELPAGLANVVADSDDCTVAAGEITCLIGDLAPGASVTVDVTGKVVPGQEKLVNVASVKGDEPDPDPDNDTSTTNDPVTPQVDLGIEKGVAGIDPGQSLVPGQVFEYTFEVTNLGPDNGTGVKVTDTLPDGIGFVSSDDCDAAGQDLTCMIGNLAAGASKTLSVKVKAGNNPSGEVVNLAKVAGNEEDPDLSNNEDSVTISSKPLTDLAVTKKTVSPEEVKTGDTVTYKVTVVNHGLSDATGVVLTDTLPSGLTDITFAGADCDIDAGVITCEIGDLAAEDEVVVTVTGKVIPGQTSLTNTVSVTGDQEDPVPGNNTDKVTDPVTPQVDLEIAKTASVGKIVPGTTFDYTFVVTNNGPDAATGVTVTDTLPAGVTFVSSDGCTATGQVLTCAVGSLAADASVTLTVKVKADPALRGDVINTASVKGDQPDQEQDNDDSTDETPTDPKADLGVVKTKVSPDTIKTGDTVTWRLVATNHGPSKATGVVLADQLPAGVANVQISSDDIDSGVCSPVSGGVFCQVGDLAPGASVTVTVTGKVIPGQEKLANTASVEGEEPDPDPDNDTSTTDDPVTPQVDLGIEKGVTGVDPGEALTPGKEFNYTLKVTNHGPDDGTGVTVTDSLPDGLELVDAGNCDADGPDLTCEIGDLASGDSVILTVKVKAGNNVSGEVTNIANVAGDQEDPDLSNNEDSVTITSKLVADLSVTKKTVSPDEVKTGDPVTYEVTVKNHGLSDATGVVLTDQLPAGLADVQVSSDDLNANQACDLGSGELNCEIGDLDAGDSVVITVTGKVKPGQTSITNTVSVTGDQDDPNEENNTDEVTDPVTPQVDLGIKKTASVEEIVPGTTFDYTFVVTNNGPDNGTGVTVTDTLPAGIAFVSSDGCTAAGQDLTCAVGSLAADSSVTLTVKVKADPALRGDVVNTASVKGDQPDPDPENDDSTDETPTDPQADLGVVKIKVSPETIKTGDTVTWRIVVTNHGPSKATGVTVTDQLPAGLNDVSTETAGCLVAAGAVVCQIGELAPDAHVAIELTGKVAPGQESLVNTASAEGEEPDPDPDNDTSTTTDPVTPQVDLGIAKGVDGIDPAESLVPGQVFDYTFEVTNLGPDNGTGVKVTDTLPDGISFVSSNDCDAAGQDLTCQIGSLAAGDSVNLTVKVKAGNNVSGEVTNVANVTGDQDDPDLSNNEDSVTITSKLVADLSVTKKTVSPEEVKTGDTVTYEVTVKNHGLSGATGVVLTDTLPSGLTDVDTDSDDCDIDAGVITCEIGDLAAEDDVVVTVTGRVIPGQTSITNTVSVTGDQEDPVPGNNTDEVTDPVTPQVDLGIAKTASVEKIVPGTEFEYTFLVTNHGPDAATGVTVTDKLPAGVTVVSSSDCTADGQDVTCNVGPLAADGSVTLTVKVKADPALRGDVINTASVEGDQPDPEPDNDESTDETPTDPKADLGVVKTKVSPETVKTGSTVTWRLVVTNHGPSKATGVVLADQLPAGLTNINVSSGDIDADAACGLAAGVVSCQIGELDPGQGVTVTVSGKVAPGQENLVNVASVDGEEPDPDPDNDTSTTDDPVTPQVDLGIGKNTDVDPETSLQPAQEFSYSFKVTNHGPDNGTGIKVTDQLPAGISFVESEDCSADGQDVTCDVGALAAGSSVTLTIKVKTGNNVSGSVTNVAQVAGDQEDPDLSNNEDSVTISSELAADLGVTKKTVSPETVRTGDTVTYRITVVNHGLSDATGVKLTDELPDGLTGFAVASDDIDADSDCAITAGAMTCDIGAMPAGSSVVVTVTGEVKPGQTEITNAASVKSDQPDPNPQNDTDEVTDPVTPQVDLKIAKAASVETIVPGTEFDYTFRVTNQGPDNGTGITVTDQLPAGISFVESEDCSADGQDVTCDVGALAAGTSVTFTVKVKADPSLRGAVENTATVEGGEEDPDPDDNASTDETPSEPSTDLAATKTRVAPEGPVRTGDEVTWELVVTNNGPSSATNVILTDELPAGLVDVATDSESCTVAGDTVSCAIGELASGESATVRVTGKVAPHQKVLVNTATVDGGEPDPDPENNTPKTEDPVTPQVGLKIVKTASVETIVPGTTFDYSFEVSNQGPDNGTGIKVTDQLPEGISFVSSDDCTASGRDVTCDVGALAAGETVTATIKVKAAPSLRAEVENTATVTGNEEDPDPEGGTSTVTTPSTPSADLSVKKSKVAPKIVRPGSRIAYRIKVTNHGPSKATGVTVTDTLPAGLKNATAGRGCQVKNRKVTCLFDGIAVGKTVTIRVKATVTGKGSHVVNWATVKGNEADPNPRNNSARVKNRIVKPKLTLKKKAYRKKVKPGQSIRYRITVRNTVRGSVARNVLVCDDIPKYTTVVGKGHQGFFRNGMVCWRLKRIAFVPGEKNVRHRMLRLRVDRETPNRTKIVNHVIMGKVKKASAAVTVKRRKPHVSRSGGVTG